MAEDIHRHCFGFNDLEVSVLKWREKTLYGGGK
jgi:hypothetical protein